MAIITISRGSYGKGKEVAVQVAEKLGYRCIAREVVLDASKEFDIPEIRLIRAIHDAPSILERFRGGKEKYVAFFRSALLKQLRSDNVVYHGLAGHFFLNGVKHALKVRIIADMEDRVRAEMQSKRISREDAARVLANDDEQRRKWSLHLYGIDTADPSLYDMVIHIGGITVDNAVSLICQVAEFDRFQTKPESRKFIEELSLKADVRAALIDVKPEADISVEGTTVIVGAKIPSLLSGEQQELVDGIKRIVESVPGVTRVAVKPHRVS
ncbi:MAG: cytidylate kinase-like family protein [Syntrophobacteraceae bacterium]|nr:cytidylate kinase-like family protein [Syntrophobacteraceae bacterium]